MESLLSWLMSKDANFNNLDWPLRNQLGYKNDMKRIWMLIYIIFGRNWPDYFGGAAIRSFLAKRFLYKSGKNISIGYGSRIHKLTEIGESSGIGRNCEIQPHVKIGSNVMMGPDVYILTQNHCTDRTDIPMNHQGFRPEQPVSIEDDCWIGARTIILPGVTIGKGSIIGAGSVVTKSIPSFVVAVGNPCVIKKKRDILVEVENGNDSANVPPMQ